jgi:hypothetical protein
MTARSGIAIALAAALLAACGSSSPDAAKKVRAATTDTSTTAAVTTTTAKATPKTTTKTLPATTVPSIAAPTFPPAVAVTEPPTVPATAPPVTSPPTAAAPAGPPKLVAVPGTSPAQLKRAQALLDATIATIGRFRTPAQAYAAGYRSINDAVTGDEHYVNWSLGDDGHILDPKRPESVVYEYVNGKQTAVALMFSLPLGSSFADVPDVGGALTQWHVHSNLCITEDAHHRVVSGVTSVNGTCPAGTSKAGNTPMLHVWVVPNPCGPFAALEGIGAGQVPPGQTRNCDTTNASVP